MCWKPIGTLCFFNLSITKVLCMFNRRFLRIKAFQALYAYQQDESPNRSLHEKNLQRSLDKATELYIFLLAFPKAFREFVSLELDTQKNKYIPVQTLITPLEAIANNKAIQLIENSTEISEAVKKHKVIWNNTRDLFKELIQLIKKNKSFIQYTQKNNPTFTDDKLILNEIIEVLIAESDIFENYIEDRFINWEDDQVLVCGQVLKTIAELNENQTTSILQLAQDSKEEHEFVVSLFNAVIENGGELTDKISAKTKNWDTDRLAIIDLLLMRMALCEMLYFPHIPIKATINEYLEIAKLYSTPNSFGFINGILDKIHQELKTAGKINKTGRGLVE